MSQTNQVNTVTTTNVVPVGAIYDADGNFVTLVGAAGTPISFSGGSGSSTTLSASSTVTFSGGTANGVAYLNGSKVLTTGSALSFDGTNLGLGVTPSASWSGQKAFQISPSSAFTGSTAFTGVATNAIATAAGWTANYLATGTASLYAQSVSTGAHTWYTAPSGTAGNAITFTQAMTLDASGNLGIGTSSPDRKLDVESGNAEAIRLSSGSYLTTGQGPWIGFDGGPSANWNLARIQATRAGAEFQGNLLFFTNNSTSDAAAATERMRLDSSGNLLVGTTTASSSITNGFTVTGGAAVTALGIGHVTGSGSGTNYVVFNYNGGVIGSITQNGTTAVLYNLTSDQRLKENIVDAPEFGSVIDSIKVRSFDWKTDQTHQRAGFVAQELVTVAPEAVHQPADPEEMMGVDYSKLVPMLVKEIQSLRIRIAQLEAK